MTQIAIEFVLQVGVYICFAISGYVAGQTKVFKTITLAILQVDHNTSEDPYVQFLTNFNRLTKDWKFIRRG